MASNASSTGPVGTGLILSYDGSGANAQASDLWQLVPANGGKAPKAGTARVFFGPNGVTAVSSLGEGFTKKKENEKREAVRRAVGGAVKGLKGVVVPPEGTAEVKVDTAGDAHAAGSFAFLFV
jgi:aminopeptidase